MLEDYKLIFDKSDLEHYNNLFEQIYSDKFKQYCFETLYCSKNVNIQQYNFTDNYYINSILQQKNSNLKLNKIISDFIKQDFNCISKHFFKDNNKYTNNIKGQFCLQLNEIIKVPNIDNYTFYYQYKDNKTIFYFCKNDSLQNISPLFDNFNNKLHKFKQIQTKKQFKYWHVNKNLFFENYNQFSMWDECYTNQNNFCLCHFNNIFDQNWYNLFCKNIKLFFDQITK